MKKEYAYIRKTVYWQGKQYAVRGKTEAEAYEKLGELKASLKRGDMTVGENTSVNRWYREWLSLYKENAGLTKKVLGYMTKNLTGTLALLSGE